MAAGGGDGSGGGDSRLKEEEGERRKRKPYKKIGSVSKMWAVNSVSVNITCSS